MISKEPFSTELYTLVRKNMKGMYEGSGMGWVRADKIEEMEDDELSYFVAREGDQLLGFVSFMHTEEEEKEVVYLYELQVGKGFQGEGLGKELMNIVIAEAQKSGKPIMLTVFLMNVKAVEFYTKIGFSRAEKGPEVGRGVRGWMQMVLSP
ncbi:putative N-acetyltransferase [Yarrowia sp. B02]|nr:putative N-acetyltransferase [Yarrowia sp. B02]